MTYTKPLPKLKELKHLALEIKNFPIAGLGIAQCAEHLGYDDEAVDFVRLFSEQMVFNSRTDLLDYCSLLEKLMREERLSLPEHLRSP